MQRHVVRQRSVVTELRRKVAERNLEDKGIQGAQNHLSLYCLKSGKHRVQMSGLSNAEFPGVRSQLRLSISPRLNKFALSLEHS